MHKWDYDIVQFDVNTAMRIICDECDYLCRELEKRGLRKRATLLAAEKYVFDYEFWTATRELRNATAPIATTSEPPA